jgi:multidrug efflux pump subunit AcrA (membrane-fusion protein)
VTQVTQAASNGSMGGASADLKVSWADGQQTPGFGTPIVARVTVQQKENVLVVPKSAVRQSGGRSMVELQDGSLRHLVNVQVGIRTDASVEILSGLTEGQMVLAGVAR